MKELVTFRKYLTEGVINEGVNLDDKLDTLEDFNSWMEGDEIVQIFNDIADVENPIRSGDDLISGYGWVHREDEEREEMFDDIYKGYTKRETIKKRMDVFYQSTLPVSDYYQKVGILTTVNSMQPIDKVYGDIKSGLMH